MFFMKQLSKWIKQLSFNKKILLLGLLASAIAFSSLLGAMWLYRDSPTEFWAGFLTNAGTELLSIAITVLILNVFYQRAEDERLKQQLIREMGSPDNSIALRAVQELIAYRWLFDGSLRGARLGGANLENANLVSANLEEAELWRANLSHTRLRGANLSKAKLQTANLTEARIIEAKLENVDLSNATLEKAKLWDTSLQGSILQMTNFNYADLRGTNLLNTEISNCEFVETKYSGRTLWPDGFSPDWSYMPDE